MDLVTCIEGRNSIRDFASDPVEDSVIDEALRLANRAPSAGNLQARDFVIVKNARAKKALAEAAYRQDFIATAPVAIVCCANLERIKHYGQRGKDLYCLQDVAAAVENILLYVHSKGLGAVWVGAFDEVKVSKLLSLPDHARPVAIVPIGYSVDQGVPRRRLSQEKIVHREVW